MNNNDILAALTRSAAKLEHKQIEDKQNQVDAKLSELSDQVDYLTECVVKLLFEISSK